MNGCTCVCSEHMARTYTKGKRAEKEADTRQRIVEAALQLHGEIGPNSTTISLIAERAGVQRHTVYAHLPDDRAVFMACSGLFDERAPVPSPEEWAGINDPVTRLRTALAALYAWYARNEAVIAHVQRDAEQNATLREISDLRFGGPFSAIYHSLVGGMVEKEQAALALALSFYTWRTLTREGGLAPVDAVELMVSSVTGADR
jgi:AcrR family transcriptional regulator